MTRDAKSDAQSVPCHFLNNGYNHPPTVKVINTSTGRPLLHQRCGVDGFACANTPGAGRRGGVQWSNQCPCPPPRRVYHIPAITVAHVADSAVATVVTVDTVVDTADTAVSYTHLTLPTIYSV